MRQIVLLVVLAVVVLIGGGVLLLGAFPPRIQPQPVAHTLPNDQFSGH